MKLYAIPDIHGRSDLLKRLCVHLAEEHQGFPGDEAGYKMIFLGDMIDRGPDSKGVIDIIREYQVISPKHVVVLAGNHEWLAIYTYARARLQDRHLWYMNGGVQTIASYSGDMPEDVVKWMADLPVEHREDGFFFSHAPVPEIRRPENIGKPYTLAELTWTYDADEAVVARRHENGVIGVCGHIHQLRRGIIEPRFYDHYIFADAGCGCHPKAPLVAVEVKSRTVITIHPDAEVKG